MRISIFSFLIRGIVTTHITITSATKKIMINIPTPIPNTRLGGFSLRSSALRFVNSARTLHKRVKKKITTVSILMSALGQCEENHKLALELYEQKNLREQLSIQFTVDFPVFENHCLLFVEAK